MLRFISLNKIINSRYLIFDNLLEYWNSINLSDINLKYYLIVACRNGQLNSLKFVHNKSNISSYSSDLFLESCENGHYKIACWLVGTFSDIDIHAKNEFAFRYSCENGHYQIACWLLETFSDINVHTHNEQAFRISCLNGHYEIARWLVESFSDIDVHIENEYAFQSSCLNGHYEIAHWLVETFSNFNVCVNDNVAFRYSCQNGCYEIARWLVETFSDIDVHANNEYAFRWSCLNGHYKISHWLFDNYNVDIYARNNWAFNNSKLIRIKWLLDIIDVRYNDDILIKSVFEFVNCVDRLVKLKYLCELCPEYHLEFVGDTVVGYKIFELFIKGYFL